MKVSRWIPFLTLAMMQSPLALAVDAHALIMAIGDYPSPIPKLTGVPYDTTTATEIARRMGVPAQNIRTLRDGELTLDGMRRAFDDLEAKLSGNDQVFIYYSGHGGRQSINEGGVERCAESLITADAQGFLDTEMEARLKRLSQKSQKTIVLLDACHSGGVTTRAIATATPMYTPKSYSPPGQNCTKPSNVLTRSVLAAKSAGPGNGGGNYVYIAAARDNEISLDQPGKGGVASRAWLNCLGQTDVDKDGSGGLSAEEIRQCAQQQINTQLQNAPGFLPHHVVVTGNPDMVLSYAGKGGTLVAAMPTATAPAPVVAKPAPLATLGDIFNSRDDRRLVTLTPDKTKLKIGRDAMSFSLSSREGGYAYVLMVGSDGKTFDLLFPNQLDRNNQIEPGATLRLPRASWELMAGGPPGKNTLLAVVTDSPRNFSSAGLAPSGPFSTVNVNALAAKDIQLVTSSPASAEEPECSESSRTRTLAIKKRCSTGYGAAMLTIEEVD